MSNIPVIVGFGGVNTAGRGSFHHAYNRIVHDSLDQATQQRTLESLAALMQIDQSGGKLTADQKQFILDHTLIRQVEQAWFDTQHVPLNKRMPVSVTGDSQTASVVTKARNLPNVIPDNWAVADLGAGKVRIDMHGDNEFLLPTDVAFPVQAAGQLPTGFEPGKLYPSRSHPRGLEMTVYGASDALGSLGIDWDHVRSKVAPDQISVYAGSAMGQLDANGHGNMLSSRFDGRRVSSKNCAFGLAEMAADFINAYVLGSVGNTGTYVGACASFLYNLRQGVQEIKSGNARVAFIGNSEAPVNPDVMAGFTAMGALATDEALLQLDASKGLSKVDYRRACRPFSDNCGFTIAESAQYIVLFDDELAMELGATVHGAVTDVFVNADGFKKSISSPGVGNYITVAKSMASARSILGDEAIRHRSMIQAHGTSTPQNRTSESDIMNEVAKTFGIEKWPVAAIKSYLGHSLGPAAGDQLLNTLGIWHQGIIPGITTISHIADDVAQSNLAFSSEHREVGQEGIDVAILNSKGFGGNNASATVLAPHIVERMLSKKHGSKAVARHSKNNESVQKQAADYDESAMRGEALPVYLFDNNVLSGDDLTMSDKQIDVPGFAQPIDLDIKSPYADLL